MKLLGRFYWIFCAVVVVVVLGVTEMHVRASREDIAPEGSFMVSQIPGCSYGYGQCVKSCKPHGEELSVLGAAVQKTCLNDCNFLYHDCKER